MFISKEAQERLQPQIDWAGQLAVIMRPLEIGGPLIKETRDEIGQRPELLLRSLQTWDGVMHFINDRLIQIDPEILELQGMSHTKVLTGMLRTIPGQELPCLIPASGHSQNKIATAHIEGVHLTNEQMINGNKNPIPQEVKDSGNWTKSHLEVDPDFRREGIIAHLLENTIRQDEPFSTLSPDTILDSMLEVLGAHFRSTEVFKILYKNGWYNGIGEPYLYQLSQAMRGDKRLRTKMTAR